jgi:RNA polymerase sigma-70 factor (ECF subfamily)
MIPGYCTVDFVAMVKSRQIPLNSKLDKLQLEFEELQEKLKNTIENLQERQKQVYILSRREELSNKEIAIKIGIPVNTVENHMVKAMKFIRASVY